MAFRNVSAAAVALVCLLTAVCTGNASAQDAVGGFKTLNQPKSGKKTPRKPGSAWTLEMPLGFRKLSTIDTLLYNYQRQAVPSLATDAYASTGNLGGPGIDMIFFNRPDGRPFFFADALYQWLPSAFDAKYYNVYIPMTLLSYNTGGSKQNAQDRLRGVFAGNVNRRIGLTATVDYLYSKGSYQGQSTKDLSFTAGGYYAGDRYEVQAMYAHYNMLGKENGGITDPLYITDPAVLQAGVSKIEPLSIPVNLQDAHSRVSGQQLMVNQAYNVGYWRKEEVNDTLTRDVYVPVTKFVWTLGWQTSRHVFHNEDTDGAEKFWKNRYLTTGVTHDNTYASTLSNTVGIELLEGFRKWARFGLSAFITHELRHYAQTAYTASPEESSESGLTPLPEGFSISPKANRNLVWVGGELAKRKGSILTYAARARFGLIGDVAGDIDLRGAVATRFRLLSDSAGVSAYARFRNQSQPYLLQHYISNHFAWNNDFGKTRSLRIGGEINLRRTGTTISAGVENLQNYVYFDRNSLPRQYGKSVRIFSASLKQNLRFGIWNWRNSLTYQATSNADVIPLPALSVYSNMYLEFTAFKVLRAQIGVDCNYYTRYRGLDYQPATMTFHTCGDARVGNYIWMDAYATFKLKKVRFFVMVSHVNQGLFSKDYFAMPLYPMNPRKFQLGLSIDFAD